MSKTLTRTICCKLDVDGHDAALAATQGACTLAATWIARVGWDAGIPNPPTAHHRVSGATRADFGLGAQLAVCASAQAGEAIKAVKAQPRDPCPAVGPRRRLRSEARTSRLMRLDRVSLTTLEGRVLCRLVCGARHQALLVDSTGEVGGADLVWRCGVYSRHLPPRREAPDAHAGDGATLGVDRGIVDRGIVNRATHSEPFTGALVHLVRNRSPLRRPRLQTVGTRTAKRRIRRMGQREARFQQDTTHCISKKLVPKAAVARQASALANRSGIRERTTVRRVHRYARHSWAFFQLRHDIRYTAAWAGVPVHVVDPRNTSRSGSQWGHCEKANRKSQESFLCQRCGFAANADENAALNSSRTEWAAVTRPLASPLAG